VAGFPGDTVLSLLLRDTLLADGVIERFRSSSGRTAMWVRIGSFRAKPNMIARLVESYNERAVPQVRAFPGNLGCLLLEPTAAGDEFVAITIWEDRAAADRYESSGAAAEVVALVRDYFAGPPTLRSYESSSSSGISRPS
jgi:quinol monooxygenase YgiN